MNNKKRIHIPSKAYIVKRLKESWPWYLLLLPGLIYLIIFAYGPMSGLLIAFKNYRASKGIWGSPWVGFKNFEFLFKTGDVWTALFNTVFYNLFFIFVGTAVSVLMALMLYEFKNRLVKTYQTALLIPYFMSWVVVAYVFNTLLDMEHGLFNQILGLFGKDAVNWYNEPEKWPLLLSFATVFITSG